MKFTVNKSQIRRGERQDFSNCPIGLCLQKAFPNVHLHVNTDFVRLGGVKVPLPGNAKRFIKRFDNGEKVGPFSFEL